MSASAQRPGSRCPPAVQPMSRRRCRGFSFPCESVDHFPNQSDRRSYLMEQTSFKVYGSECVKHFETTLVRD